MLGKIAVGSHIKTTKEYKEKMYEPLYFEEILDGIVINIDKDNVVTYELIDSTCNFKARFNHHMNSWRVGNVKHIGLGWLELKK